MKKKVNESNKEVIDKLMNNPSVVTALKRIMQVSRTLSPEEQMQLSKRLAQMPLTKSSAMQKTQTVARQGDFFEAKKNDSDDDSDDDSEPKKEPKVPLSAYVSSIKGNQFWRKYMIKLASSTDSIKKAQSVYSLMSSIPKQDQKFKQTLRKLLNR